MYLCQFAGLLHRKRALLQCAVLVLNLSFFVYLRFKSAATNNWRADVKYCFAQVGECMTRGSTFGIENGAGTPPLCYSDAGSDDTICYSSTEALGCMTSVWHTHNDVVLDDMFESQYSRQTYFDYDIIILAFTTILIVTTTLFQTSKSNFVSEQEEAFSSVSDSAKMNILSVVLSVIVVSLMFASSQAFSLMRVVSCSLDNGHHSRRFLQQYNASDSAICQSCKSNVRSIIFPDDSVVEDYPSFCVTLALLIITICSYTAVFPPSTQDEQASDREDEHSADSPRGGERHGDSESSRYFGHSSNSQISPRRYAAAWNGERLPQTAAEVFRDHSTFKRIHEGEMRLWKFGYKDCGLDSLGSPKRDVECAVCLERIRSEASDSVSGSVDTPSRTYRKKSSALSSFSRVTGRRAASVTPVVGSPDSMAMYLVPVRLPCEHIFHERCICAWMRSHSTCPICRADLVTGDMREDGQA